jgi:hypothetical protein
MTVDMTVRLVPHPLQVCTPMFTVAVVNPRQTAVNQSCKFIRTDAKLVVLACLTRLYSRMAESVQAITLYVAVQPSQWQQTATDW